MITTEKELRALCHRALASDKVALDTEFFWERTFYPQLGIVQIGLSADDLHLVDAVALPRLPGLGEVLSSPGTKLILHDAVQDLQILSRHTGGSLPRNIFDTRRAAGFAGMLSTVSLSNLLSETLGINLSKGETRSNWLQRPLSEQQVDYARDDIRHMHELCTTLSDKARSLGNIDRLEAEMQSYDDPSLYSDPSPDSIYLRFKPYRWKPPQRPLLHALVIWREQEARRLNRPRTHIMSDADLTTISRQVPASPTDLDAIRELSRNTLKRHRETILELIRLAATVAPDALPEEPGNDIRLSAEVRGQIEQRIKQIRNLATAASMDPALVGSKADITALVHYENGNGPPPAARLLEGWRTDFLRQAQSA